MPAHDVSGYNDQGTADIGISPPGMSMSLAYYNVNSEAVRLIQMDPGAAAVGSAYGQGAYGQGGTAFDSTALGNADVIAIRGNSRPFLYAEVGSFVTSGAASGRADATFTGEADGDGEGSAFVARRISGSYVFLSTGYGSSQNDLGNFGLYATDPALNLVDPNNASGRGALVLHMNGPGAGGTGVVVPQGRFASDGSDSATPMPLEHRTSLALHLEWVGTHSSHGASSISPYTTNASG